MSFFITFYFQIFFNMNICALIDVVFVCLVYLFSYLVVCLFVQFLPVLTWRNLFPPEQATSDIPAHIIFCLIFIFNLATQWLPLAWVSASTYWPIVVLCPLNQLDFFINRCLCNLEAAITVQKFYILHHVQLRTSNLDIPNPNPNHY